MASPRDSLRNVAASPTAQSPSTGYPFPSMDLPQGQRVPRGNTRRGSTASSIASIGGTLDTNASNKNTIPELGQNAISTLLQHPIQRTGLQALGSSSTTTYRAPTQRDIPPVTLTNIPHIDSKAFYPYLSQVGSLYDAFQRAKSEGDGDSALFQRDRKDSRDEEWQVALAKRPGSSRANSVSSMLSPVESPSPKRRSSAQKRTAPTPLSTIPAVYSDDDFHLENPRTFDIVSEHAELVSDPKAAPSGRKSLATNAILQEKLSWYMDTVEVHLISSISTASKSFFSALGSLRELHTEAEESIERIQKLRKDLAKIDKEMAIDGLKVVNLKQRRQNVRKLAESIMQLEDIVMAVTSCEERVDNGEVDEAFDDLDNVERLIVGKAPIGGKDENATQYTRRDLSGINALAGAFEDLGHIRLRIGKVYESKFHESLLNDIRSHVGKTTVSTTLERWGTGFVRPKAGQRRAPSTVAGYMTFGSGLRSELESEMRGLARAKYTTPAATAFKALVLKEMKSIIKKQLPSSNDDDAVSTISASTHGGRGQTQLRERSSILARNLRSLDDEDWYSMLSRIYTNSSEALRRLSVQVKVLLDISSNLPDANSKSPEPNRTFSPQLAGRPRSTSNVQLEMQQALDLSSLLVEGVDLIQNQLTKVVKVRSQQNAELPLGTFLRYFTLNKLFTDECEAISGQSGQGLKTVLDSQIKEFVSRFADLQKQSVIKVLDADKWDAKDFGDHENVILSRIQAGSTDDQTVWLEESKIWETQGQKPGMNGSATNGTATLATKDAKIRQATLDEQKYILPESAAAMMVSIEQCEHLAAGIPSMSSEIATALLDTLKLFNSRSSQLILGAGATRSAGLKNITTKHLALSSQALSFVTALTPYVREFFRRHLNQSTAQQTMTEFDNVKRQLQEHQMAINEKLVEIMSGRAAYHVKTMKAVDWEEAAKNKSVSVSPYMETLTKETATLQKVLAKHLPEPIVAGIMGPVFQNYRQSWEKGFAEVELRSEAAKDRLVADAQYFEARVSKLDGAGDLGEHILNLVKSKEVITRSAENDAAAS